MGFLGGSTVNNPPAKAGNPGSIPGGEDLLEKEMAIHLAFLPEIAHGQRSLLGYRRVYKESVMT